MALAAIRAAGLPRPEFWQFPEYGATPAEYRVAVISFILVVCKAGFEAFTGRMFFGFLDFGLLGEPVAVSHAGGVIGGLMCFLLCSRSILKSSSSRGNEALISSKPIRLRLIW